MTRWTYWCFAAVFLVWEACAVSPTPVPSTSPSLPPSLAPSLTSVPTATQSPTLAPSPAPSLTSVPTATASPTLTPTRSPTHKPTEVVFKDFQELGAGSAREALIQAIVFAVLLALAGIGMGVVNYRHDQERVERKRKKVAADREMREGARENVKAEGGRTEEEVEAEVLKLLPLRDFDDEELDEQANEPSTLYQIVILFWFLLYPLRLAVFTVCCAVQRQELNKAAEIGADEDVDDDTMIDGFPIDCGTKHRKFLSMAKCKADTVSRHPHKETTEPDGKLFVTPYMLGEEMGQHNVAAWPFPEAKKALGLLKEGGGFIDKYGIGMALYFKFLKTMTNVFFLASLIAIFPIVYNYTGSSVRHKNNEDLNPVLDVTDFMFLTSSGSLLGQSFVCGSAFEGERISLDCAAGTIQRVEAYFGEPDGACSCPPQQQLVPSTGDCPAFPDFSKGREFGECVAATKDDDVDEVTGAVGALPLADAGLVEPCFKGQMWTGEACCAYGVDAEHKWPEFSDLAMQPKPGCDSGAAQFIAQASCLGQTNCTIDVALNRTYSWEVGSKAPCADGTLLNGQCLATLDSPTANFTECPKSVKDWRFVVRGVCDEAEFKFRPNGQTHSRAEWALACSWCDACITFLLFCTVLWMADKEVAAVNIADLQFCSADDYTLRVKHIPPPVKGMSPDLEKLKDAIKAHFNSHMEDLPPVIKERPCKVVDVNLGMNNQETIKNMKKRGALARLLDLAVDKFNLMTEFGTGTELELAKQRDAVSVLKVKFLKVCEKVKYKKRRLEAKTAFVTFDSEEGYERVRKAYSKRYGVCGPPSAHYLRGKFLLEVTTAERPSDYIWENLSTPWPVRMGKLVVSNLLALSLLVVGFAIIIAAEDRKSRANLQAGTTDCTPYSFGWSGHPEWDLRFTNGTSVLIDREDIVHNEYPEKYNVTYPNSGLKGCFCEFVAEQSFEATAREVQFLNPYKSNKNVDTGGGGSGQGGGEGGEGEAYEQWCGAYFDNLQASQLSGQAAVLVIVVVNEALKLCFASLVAFEGHETRTTEILSLALKLFGAMLVNTALLTVLITGNLNLFFGGVVNPASQTLSSIALLAGNIGDFTPRWYQEVGAAIGTTLLINAFALNATSFIAAAKMQLFRCLDRGCTLDMTRTGQKLQVQLETMYTGPDVRLEERYAALLVCFTACVIYSGGMPLLWVVGFISFLVALLADKWAFLRVYQLPPKIGSTLARVCTDQLPFPLLVHTMLAAWSFSSPTLYDYAPLEVVEGNVSVAEYGDYGDSNYNGTRTNPHGHRKDFMRGTEYEHFDMLSELTRIVAHPNSVPHDMMFLIWVVWFLATKVLELDEIYAWCHQLCAKKEADLAEDRQEMEDKILEAEVSKARWTKAGTLVKSFRVPGKKGGKTRSKGQEVAETEQPAGSVDDADADADAAAAAAGSGGGAAGVEGDESVSAVEVVVDGGAPGEPEDDATPPPPPPNPSEEDGEGGGGQKEVEQEVGAGGSAGEGSAAAAAAAARMVGSFGSFHARAESFKEALQLEDHELVPHHTHEYVRQGSTQATLMRHEVAALTDEFEQMSGGGIEAAALKVEEQHASNVAKRKKKKDAKNKKGGKGLKKGGFGEDEEDEKKDEAERADKELEEKRSFRESWLQVLEFVQQNRGRRLIEGNADYFWCISTEELKKQVYQKVLDIAIRDEFQKELDFRTRFPDLASQVTRNMQGLASYDFNCNSDYHEAFALDSKSLKAYQRGKIQVSGADFELAHKGFFNWLRRNFFGISAELDVVFPEINTDMNAAAKRHTTAVGIDPTKVNGPRFVLNIRVPPPPPNLIIAQDRNDTHHVKVTDMEDPNYDEWEESWQYLKLTIRDVFEYRVRLPKGLQYKKVPEIQVELPAVEQTLSTVRTTMLGGERVIAKAGDEVQMGAASELHHKQEVAKRTTLNASDAFTIKVMQGVSDNNQAEDADHAAVGAAAFATGAGDDDAAAGGGGSSRGRGGSSKNKLGKPDKGRRQKREESAKAQEEAAKKIQACWMGKAARLHLARMRSWQNRTLLFLEGFPMTIFALSLVILDLALSLGFAEAYPGPQQGIAFFSTAFFTLELSLRFGCYAFLSRGKGLDVGDLDFFTHDYLRLVDLCTVVVDLASTVILLSAQNKTGGTMSRYLRSSKGARVVRAAKLVKVVRVARLSRATKFTNREAMYKLTGHEPIDMQRYHITAPKEVEMGNRIEVTIPHLGKLQIQFPVYSKEDQPIQFHLPVCCKHHLGVIAPNCFLVKPTADEAAEGKGQYSGEARGKVSLGQFGWCQLWSPKDDDGLLDPPHHGGLLHRLLHKDKVLEDADGQGGKHKEKSAERRERVYKDFYDDFSKHRVWYQAMAFAPKPVVKDFHDLSLFEHELEPFVENAVVLTLAPGELKGERIECVIGTDRAPLHLQKTKVHVPGVGDVVTTILATDEVTVPGLHGHPLHALGVLPWFNNAAEKKQLVPSVIGEVTFDFPAIMLPRVTEVINMKLGKAVTGNLFEDEGAAKELGGGKHGGNKHGESVGKYLERECFTRAFQIMPAEFVKMMRVAQKKIRHDHLVEAKEAKKDKARERKEDRLREKQAAKEAREEEEQGFKEEAKAKAEAHDKVRKGESMSALPQKTPEKEKEGSGGCFRGRAVKNQLLTEQETEMVPTSPSTAAAAGDDFPLSLNLDNDNDAAAAAKEKDESKGGGAEEGGDDGGGVDVAPRGTSLDGGEEEKGASAADEAAAANVAAAAADEAADEAAAAAAEGVEGVEGGAPAATIGDEDEGEVEFPMTNSKRKSTHVAEIQKGILEEAQAEADANMEGVDLDSLAVEAADYQKINLARVGRFDVQWPKGNVEPFNVSFPAIKPAKQLREEVLSLIEVPSDNQAQISPLARRYQFGWVLVLMLEKTPSGADVYLRLPAYVSHKQRALGTLDPDDFASPYSNRVGVHLGHQPADSTEGEFTATGPLPGHEPSTKEEAVDRAQAAEAKVRELEAKLEALGQGSAEGASGPASANSATGMRTVGFGDGSLPEEYTEQGSAV